MRTGREIIPFFSENYKSSFYSADSSSDSDSDVDVFDADDAAYGAYLNALRPGDWKTQDHYRVLGLRSLRHRATDAQIRHACE